MLRPLLLGLLLMLAGCNLENRTATPTSPPLPTSSPIPSPQQESLATLDSAVTPECVIRADWPVYIVQPGDILTLIAEQTGSTVAEIAEGNCLSNPDDLDRGQELRVPRLPNSP